VLKHWPPKSEGKASPLDQGGPHAATAGSPIGLVSRNRTSWAGRKRSMDVEKRDRGLHEAFGRKAVQLNDANSDRYKTLAIGYELKDGYILLRKMKIYQDASAPPKF